MPSTHRNHVRQAALPLVLKGQEGRSLPLRILFVHSDAAHVDRCLEELRKTHFKVTADVVLTQQQFSQRLRSKYYDVALVEYPTPNWHGPRPLDMLHVMDRDIPCIFLTETLQLETIAELMTEGAADCPERRRPHQGGRVPGRERRRQLVRLAARQAKPDFR